MRMSSAAAFAFALAANLSAQACSIPVFRYALDRWPADKFQLEVSVQDAKDEGVAKFLRNFTDSAPTNLVPVRLKTEGVSSLAFPSAEADAAPAWSGSLGPVLAPILESPARSEIVRRILGGESGVWVLVESGKADADTMAAATMEKRLHYLAQVAALPEIDPTDPTSQLGPGPVLRASFSLVRVKADDTAEQPFLKMLGGPKGAPVGPWFALVFGRGRVLGAWPAEGFGDEQIDEACLFLLGACSCQVKRMNPGWDLLLNVDWDEKLQAIGFPAAPPEEPTPTKPKAEPPPVVSTVTIAPSTPHPISSTPPVNSSSTLAAASLVLLGGGLAGWFLRRKP